jgi:hypothetical protein
LRCGAAQSKKCGYDDEMWENDLMAMKMPFFFSAVQME